MTLRRVETLKVFWNRQARDGGYRTNFGAGMLIKDSAVAEHRRQTEEARFRALVPLCPDFDVLDVGCGTGRWTHFMAPLVRYIIATDLSDEMVEICRRLQVEVGIANAEFSIRSATDFTALPRFDLIHVGGVLQYLTDEEVIEFARQAAAHLKPGGRCVTRDSVTCQRRELRGDYPVVYRTQVEYRTLFAQGGMQQIGSARAYILPAVVDKLNRIIALRGRWLDAAIALDNAIMRHWPATWLLRAYAALTGRGCGEVPDHRFAVYAPVTVPG